MRRIKRLIKQMRKLADAGYRFFAAFLFLLGAVILRAADINETEPSYYGYLAALWVGVALGAVAQVLYERFFEKRNTRIILMAASAFLTLAYYFFACQSPHGELKIRAAVVLFALIIAFLWLPSIKSKIAFQDTFMAAFKAFFIALFFSGILFAGIAVIISAVNLLLFPVDRKIYSHMANIIFLFFTPMYFLSLVPVYPGKKDRLGGESLRPSLSSIVLASQEGTLKKEKEIFNAKIQEQPLYRAVTCPKHLEILISYILIPLTGIFTVILVLYILENIRDDFWTDNLLEPMIVGYSAAVIFLCILSGSLKNSFARWFKRIGPKVLVPIVLFQMIATSMNIEEYGVTHPRYYVVLYGIFALTAGVLFSVLPARRTGIIAPLLILLSMVSVFPPADAFTVSLKSQTKQLFHLLTEYGMLRDGKIIPGTGLTEETREKIIESVNYLSTMEYTGKVSWMPENFDYYEDFYRTFGFVQNEQMDGKPSYLYLSFPSDTPVAITGYDCLVFTSAGISDGSESQTLIGTFEKNGEKYRILKITSDKEVQILVMDEGEQTVIAYDVTEIFGFFKEDAPKEITKEEDAVFTAENDKADLKLVVQSIQMDWGSSPGYCMSELDVLVGIR